MKMTFFFFTFLSALAFIPLRADAQVFEKLDQYLEVSNYFQCEEFHPKKRVKIALIERSFGTKASLREKRGKTLPKDFELLFKQREENLGDESFHGEYVLDAYLAYLTKLSDCMENAPKIYLLPTDGYTEFKRAVDKIIELDVDIVLYNTVHDYLGNGDASDFLNQYVNRALDQGVAWINAVGNYEGFVYQDRIKDRIKEDSQLLEFHNSASRYRGDENLYFVCEAKRGEECNVQATLTWNAFQEREDQGTNKDLNFGLFDEIGKNIESSARRQTVDTALYEKDPINNTFYAYERIETKLKPGTYSFKIKAEEGDWDREDFFRLALKGTGLRWLSRSPKKANSVYPPADNPKVISVGAFDSKISSEYKSIYKPDMLAISSVIREEQEFRGSSIAASLYAAQFTLIKALFPEKSNVEIYKLVKKRFAENRCHFSIDPNSVSEELADLKRSLPSLRLVPSPLSLKLLVPADPFSLFDFSFSAHHFIGYSAESGFEKVRLSDRKYYIEDGGIVVQNQAQTSPVNTCLP